MYEAKEVNIIDNYDVYFHMFQYWYPDQPAAVTIPFRGDYQMLKQQCGYHDAYRILVTTLCPIGQELGTPKLLYIVSLYPYLTSTGSAQLW